MQTKRKFMRFLSIAIITFVGLAFLPSKSTENDLNYLESNLNQITPFQSSDGIISTTNDNILYWVQLSDIHINPDLSEHTDNLIQFCNETLPVVQPNFVVVSGDSVDGGTPDARQQRHPMVEEYQLFKEIITTYNSSLTEWHIAIGNHEQYDTFDRSPYYDYFSNESNYVFNVTTSFGLYRFIVIDTTQRGGMTNFFNLWGEMDTEKLDLIENLLKTDDPNPFNHTIVVGHHPIEHIYSQKSTSGHNFQEILTNANVTAYLNGHVHQTDFYRVVDELIEIMAPAFEHEPYYRICALDKDRLSFTDQISGIWPAAVITNPIDAKFATDTQPLSLMHEDGEIRVLIFDPNPILQTKVMIDGNELGSLEFVGENLWRISYDSSKYIAGVHTLSVIIESDSGRLEKTQQFQLSEPFRIPIRNFGNVIISFPIQSVLTGAIIIFEILAFSSVLLPRIWKRYYPQINEQYISLKPDLFRNFISRHYIKPWIQAAYLPLNLTLILLVIPSFVLFGPLLIGEFLTDEIGVMFIFGVFIRGYRVLTFQFLLYANVYLIAGLALQYFCIRAWKNEKLNLLWFYLLLVIAVPIGFSIMIASYYGPIAGLFNPIHLLIYGCLMFALKIIYNNRK